MTPEHQEFYADRFRMAQAQKVLRLFKSVTGFDAETPEELVAWAQTHLPAGPIQPDREDLAAVGE